VLAKWPYALAALGLWLWGAGGVFAEGGGVHVRPAGAELLEAQPRGIVTTTFRVTNRSGKRREFLAQVKLPSGWKLITPEFPFKLDAGQTEVRLVSFLVARTTLAGRYQVTYSVHDRTAPSTRDQFTIGVVVAAREELALKLLDSPRTIIAGDRYKARFVLANQGNAPARIDLSLRSANQLPATVDPQSCSLNPAESKVVVVTVETSPALRTEMRHSLRLTAKAVGAKTGEVRVEARSTVDIVPRVSGIEDPYHRLPVRLTLRACYGDNGRNRGGVQTEISGHGPLDSDRRAHIEFLFRGPDLTSRSVYGPRDEYRVSLVTKNLGLYLGDRAYTLTPLTELQTFGRGAEVKLGLENIILGGYCVNTRWEEPGERQAAAYAKRQFGEHAVLSLSYLRKKLDGVPPTSPARLRPQGDVLSLRGQFRPFQHMAADVEVGTGRNRDGGSFGNSNACRAELEGTLGKARYQLRLIHAGPDFPGYYSDVSFVSASVVAPLRGRLGIHADYRHERNNLDRDPARGSAPLDTYCRIGLDYRLARATIASLDYERRRREDRLAPPQFHEGEDTLGLTLAHHFRELTVSASAEAGRTEDHLANRRSRLQQYRLSAFYTPGTRQSYNAFVEYRDGGGSRAEKDRRLTAGLTGSWRLTDRTAVVLAARKTGFERAHDGSREVLELRVTHMMANKSSLHLAARRTSWRGADRGNESAVMLEYRLPFGVPLRRKKTIGSVKGRIYDAQTGRGLADTVLRLNGATAVSDRHGHYAFPAVKPGKYYLRVDRRSMGIGKVADRRMPHPVAVAGATDTEVDIGFVPSARLSGRVVLYRRKDGWVGPLIPPGDRGDAVARSLAKEPSPELVEDGGVPNIVVELADGQEVLRCMTDARGRFSFETVRPGRWTLRAHPSGLPNHHRLEADTLEAELAPGQAKRMRFSVVPISRPVLVIESGGTLVEEAEKP